MSDDLAWIQIQIPVRKSWLDSYDSVHVAALDAVKEISWERWDVRQIDTPLPSLVIEARTMHSTEGA